MKSPSPRLVGILGNPLEHSLSPSMQNAWFQALELPFIYLPFCVSPEDFYGALEGLLVLGARGVNITLPYKQDAWRVADELSPEAERAGAVNTLLFHHDALWGYNTDVLALQEGLSRLNLPQAGGRCVLLGSGGAAAGALAALGSRCWNEVLLCCRNMDKGENLVERHKGTLPLKVLPWKALEKDLGSPDLWINATSLGLPSSPWPEGALEKVLERNAPRNLVDFVYSPGKKTPPIAWAKEHGVPCVTGEELLVDQGAEAFRLFTGREVPPELRHLPAYGIPREADR